MREKIHPTALVDGQAELAADVVVGPYAVIGPHVVIGQGSHIGAHCVVEGHTRIGRDNRIFQFCSLGGVPQDKKYAGEPTERMRSSVTSRISWSPGSTGRLKRAPSMPTK